MINKEQWLLAAVINVANLINTVGDYHAYLDKSGNVPQLVIKEIKEVVKK